MITEDFNEDRIKERVQKGMEWLDEHQPGWLSLADESSLKIDDNCHCILGQVFGNYHCKRTEDIAYNTREQLGFTLCGADNEYWDMLQEEWVRQIKKRRKQCTTTSST